MSNLITVDFQRRRIVLGANALVTAPLKQTVASLASLSAFERARRALEARFGDTGLPAFVTKAWRQKKKHTEPYAFGDAGNIQWGTEREKWSKRGQWNRPVPFAMPIHDSTAEIGKAVVNGGTDPMAWMEAKYRITFDHIQGRHGRPLKIHTRSDLIAHDDYLSELDTEFHEVVFYLTDYSSDTVRQIEPGVPSNKRRQQAIAKLRASGVKVTVVIQRPEIVRLGYIKSDLKNNRMEAV